MDLLLELLVAAVVIAAATVGITLMLRSAPFISKWNEEGIKPWACDLCMTFWITLIICALGVLVPYETRPEAIAPWMPSFALAYTWLTRINPMPEAFAGIPDEPPISPLSSDEEE